MNLSILVNICLIIITVVAIIKIFLNSKKKNNEYFYMSLPTGINSSSMSTLSSSNMSSSTENDSSSGSTFSSSNMSSSSFLKDYLGPEYNYIKKIKTPQKLKVTQKPDLFALLPDIKASKYYVNTLVTKPSLGNSFFVKSGTCNKKTSVPECQGKDRYIYVNNFSTGLVPCTDYKSPNKGLIPGVIEDASYLNPYEIFKNLSGLSPSYTSNCTLRTEKVGSKKKKRKNETRCSVPSPLPECLPAF